MSTQRNHRVEEAHLLCIGRKISGDGDCDRLGDVERSYCAMSPRLVPLSMIDELVMAMRPPEAIRRALRLARFSPYIGASESLCL